MDHYTEDSFKFVEDIKSVSLSNTHSASYVVTSLFTNIPLKEAIYLAVTLLLQKEPNWESLKMI